METMIGLLTTTPKPYQQWITESYAAGVRNVTGLLRQVRQSGQVVFEVAVASDGTVTHTVRLAN